MAKPDACGERIYAETKQKPTLDEPAVQQCNKDSAGVWNFSTKQMWMHHCASRTSAKSVKRIKRRFSDALGDGAGVCINWLCIHMTLADCEGMRFVIPQ